MSNTTLKIARAGVIAALYAALSLVTLPVASGAIQFRASEGLTLLALVFPEAIPALTVGCMLSNLITGCAPWDIVLGSAITLVAAALTYLTGKMFFKTLPKIIVGGIFPVVLNAFLLPLIWILCYGGLEYAYMLQAAFLLLSQGVSVYLIGSVIYVCVMKYYSGKASALHKKK